METIEFKPRRFMIGSLSPVVHKDTITAEPMLYSASPSFARSYGGPLTRAALDQLRKLFAFDLPYGYHWVIDSRSHMLMPGQYPAIPGWHCDGVYRDGYDKQPVMSKMRDDIWHAAVHVSTHEGGVSDTLFADTPMTMNVDPEAVWKSVHRRLAFMEFLMQSPGGGEVVMFNQPTLHRAAPCHNRGWRWWMRASMYQHPPHNKVGRHVQVYTTEGGGW